MAPVVVFAWTQRNAIPYRIVARIPWRALALAGALALMLPRPISAASTAVLPEVGDLSLPQAVDPDPVADPETVTEAINATVTATEALCDIAANRAAAASDVPLDVLRAITRTETGRTRNGVFAPWPWTVNMEGKGVWFDSRAEAVAYAQEHFDRGARSFDMGCFQVNYRWHGQHFSDLEAMMDPFESARYAARFLAELHADSGDWDIAAGHYHSRLPKFADRYRARYRALRADLAEMPAPSVEIPASAAPPLAFATLPATPGAVQLNFPAGTGGLLTAGQPLFD